MCLWGWSSQVHVFFPSDFADAGEWTPFYACLSSDCTTSAFLSGECGERGSGGRWGGSGELGEGGRWSVTVHLTDFRSVTWWLPRVHHQGRPDVCGCRARALQLHDNPISAHATGSDDCFDLFKIFPPICTFFILCNAAKKTAAVPLENAAAFSHCGTKTQPELHMHKCISNT